MKCTLCVVFNDQRHCGATLNREGSAIAFVFLVRAYIHTMSTQVQNTLGGNVYWQLVAAMDLKRFSDGNNKINS